MDLELGPPFQVRLVPLVRYSVSFDIPVIIPSYENPLAADWGVKSFPLKFKLPVPKEGNYIVLLGMIFASQGDGWPHASLGVTWFDIEFGQVFFLLMVFHKVGIL